MTPTRILVGQTMIVFAIVIAGIWFATQWAAALAYQPELGVPWALIGHLPVYRPWAIFLWWYPYDAYAPHVFDRAGAIAAATPVMPAAPPRSPGRFGALARITESPLMVRRTGPRIARSWPRPC
jgi:type IV secretory pathway TraG/TraD family ATPase VirD4